MKEISRQQQIFPMQKFDENSCFRGEKKQELICLREKYIYFLFAHLSENFPFF